MIFKLSPRLKIIDTLSMNFSELSQLERKIEYFALIDDFPGYLISDWGRVWSEKRSRYLKGSMDMDGYLRVELQGRNGPKTKRIARLVAKSFVEGHSDDLLVDHIDRDKTNNHYKNLRMATSAENAQNRPRYSNNSSGAKGVTWAVDKNKWRADITVQGKNYNKHCDTFKEAVKAYNELASLHHGEFAVLNPISDDSEDEKASSPVGDIGRRGHVSVCGAGI